MSDIFRHFYVFFYILLFSYLKRRDVKMKKTIKSLLIVACMVGVLLTTSITAFAATNVTKQDILDEVNNGVTVNGQLKTYPREYIKLVEDFLNNENPSQAELNDVYDNLIEGERIWASTGQLNYDDMSAAQQKELRDFAIAFAEKYGFTMIISGKDVKVTAKSGNVYSVGNFDSSNGSGNNPIKTTGLAVNTTPLLATGSALLLLAGVGVAVALKRRAN